MKYIVHNNYYKYRNYNKKIFVTASSFYDEKFIIINIKQAILIKELIPFIFKNDYSGYKKNIKISTYEI